MYEIFCTENEEDMMNWMNEMESKGYTFVSSNTYAKMGYCGLNVIMHHI